MKCHSSQSNVPLCSGFRAGFLAFWGGKDNNSWSISTKVLPEWYKPLLYIPYDVCKHSKVIIEVALISIYSRTYLCVAVSEHVLEIYFFVVVVTQSWLSVTPLCCCVKVHGSLPVAAHLFLLRQGNSAWWYVEVHLFCGLHKEILRGGMLMTNKSIT